MKNLSVFAKLAVDTYTGDIVKFNNEDGSSMTVAQGSAGVNNAIIEAVGGKWSYRNFQANKHAVFALVEEAMAELMPRNLEQLMSFCEVKNTNFGDALSFKINDSKNFRVASVASHGDIRRQKIMNKKLILPMEKIGVKVYEELDNLLSGRVDFNTYINRAIKSMADELMAKVHASMTGAYTELGSKFKVSGSFEEDKLIDLISRVGAATGAEVVVYGTKKALSKISNLDKTGEAGKTDMYNQGFVGKFFGTDVSEFKQVLDTENEFVLDDNLLFVIPVGQEAICKLAIEGTPIIIEAKDGARTDLTEEYMMIQSAGVGCLVADNFGAYKIV